MISPGILCFPFGLVPGLILRYEMPIYYFFVVFLLMWLFSDLHALEVEPRIHCFCTRRTPFESSDSYRANPLSCMKVFQPTARFLAGHISDAAVRTFFETNNQRREPDWLGYRFWKISRASVFGLRFYRAKRQSHAPRPKGFPRFAFHGSCVCVLNTKQYGVTNLWNRISSSQATFMGFYIIRYSVGWSYIVFGARIEMMGRFSAFNHHWLSRRTRLWN